MSTAIGKTEELSPLARAIEDEARRETERIRIFLDRYSSVRLTIPPSPKRKKARRS